MNRKIRFVQYGCGRMGSHTGRYAVEKGCEMAAAFDAAPSLTGRSATDFFGIDAGDVKISDAADAADIIRETKPDICIVTTQSRLCDVKDILLICAENGVNVVTSCDESIYPWNSSPAITDELDKAAKAHNCTLSGTGANETQYGGIFALYGGNSQKTDKIYAKALWNIDDYGIALANMFGVGMTPEEFDEKVAAADKVSEAERQKLIEEGKFEPSPVWNTNGWICDYLGLAVTHQSQQCIPVFADKDIDSTTLGKTIPKGKAIGMKASAVTETQEGITVETESIGIVYGQGEEDVNEGYSYGVPDTEVIIKHPHTVENTCATIVNRIPDVINAQPGYVTTSRMPILKYRANPLNLYCEIR